jgi:hypothetical protein
MAKSSSKKGFAKGVFMKYLFVLFAVLMLWQYDCKKSEANTNPTANPETKMSENNQNSSRRIDKMSDTKQTLCQMTLDLPALDGFFHPTAPNRKPLLVLKNEQVEKLNLVKFGEPVKFISADEVKELPVFEFTAVEIKENTASISFKYKVEGVKGKVTFKKDGDTWQVESKEITES